MNDVQKETTTAKWKIGDHVCFAHGPNRQAYLVTRVHPTNDGMVELEGMSGVYGEHLFVTAPPLLVLDGAERRREERRATSLRPAGMRATLDEGQRQLLILGLAELALSRPGFNAALEEIADLFFGAELFAEFKRMNADRVKATRDPLGFAPDGVTPESIVPRPTAEADDALGVPQEWREKHHD